MDVGAPARPGASGSSAGGAGPAAVPGDPLGPLASLPWEQQERACALVLKLLERIAQAPGDPKFRCVSRGSQRLQKDLLELPGGDALLRWAGFDDLGDHFGMPAGTPGSRAEERARDLRSRAEAERDRQWRRARDRRIEEERQRRLPRGDGSPVRRWRGGLPTFARGSAGASGLECSKVAARVAVAADGSRPRGLAPLRLDGLLDPLAPAAAGGAPVEYELYAVIQHISTQTSSVERIGKFVLRFFCSSNIGATPFSGHYVAHCWHESSGAWWRFDDSHVARVPAERVADEVLTSGSYVLLLATPRWMAARRGRAAPCGGGSAGARGLPWLALAVVGAAAFHDDDCELAADSPGAIVDWRRLRDLLDGPGREDVELGRILADLRGLRQERVKEQCFLGVVSACLVDAAVGTARACIEGVSLERMLASRWPILDLLAEVQRKAGGDSLSCDSVGHPSLDWTEWRSTVYAFVEKVPPWVKGLTDSDAVPAEFNDAIGEAQAVVWKASSAAVADGLTIGEWTSHCTLGVITAHAVRAVGMVIGDGDIYRIVQRALETSAKTFEFIEDALQSPWPIFGVLGALGLFSGEVTRPAQHDTRLTPADLSPLRGGAEDAARSAVWRTAAEVLRGAAAASGGLRAVMLTALAHDRIKFLMNFFKRAERLGFLETVAVVPLRQNVTQSCQTIAQLFAAQREGRLPAGWDPCLPFVSAFANRAQWLYLHVAVQLGLAALWFHFEVLWVQSPLPVLNRLLVQPSQVLPYRHPCQRRCCAETDADVFLADNFYAAYMPRHTLFILRASSATQSWLQLFVQWLLTYPFADARRGLHYMAYPEEPDSVPSMSMLPGKDSMPRVAIGDLDVEQQFVGTDGWFGGIMETSQVATGIIIVRKTKMAIQFLREWLAACEDPRIMTEEPSVLGFPDYFTFKNNNDDQTAFSLVFKRYGFVPFSVGERDDVVYTGRNLAKFRQVSDAFAVGQTSDREAYLQAADTAAAVHEAAPDAHADGI
ncbi:unnamed protein product [Prorocentrum cordatum]|uniref:Peptidase C19 ubiquitin carboxyl-terminal hydrolase domain-containing protein n=1 Tax=Prorocentrum cordatum TaxID=2364126 RepID=A0ABN9X1T1_9DINO|nr:unnamed protein product [Polarella glacialis]